MSEGADGSALAPSSIDSLNCVDKKEWLKNDLF